MPQRAGAIGFEMLVPIEDRPFVLPHEAAVAEDIGAEYGGELTFQYSPQAIANSSLQARPAQVVDIAFFQGVIL